MLTRQFRLLLREPVIDQQVRHGRTIRGKPPGVARTLQQRLEEMNVTDPTLDFKVDIGFAVPKLSRRQVMTEWMKEVQQHRTDSTMEKLSRTVQLVVDMDKYHKDWLQTVAPMHIRTMAEHYGIFKDLYGDAYFHPVLPLEIDYEIDETELVRVYRGNVIKPSEASKQPKVNYSADPQSLWTLLMTTPDGSLINSENEYCHWFIGNIPGNKISEGETLIDYMRPIPVRGIGYCRYIFVLYKQKERIDYGEYKKSVPCLELKERDWKTPDFYRKYQDILTPAGLAFFQTDWDQSLIDFYHNTLNMKMPSFQYDFPKPYYKPQTWFPLKQPFNLYLDKYRDPKEINKEFLLRKLKKVHPFRPPPPKLKYPNAQSIPREYPSWLKLEIRKQRLGWGRVNVIEE